MDSWDSVAGAGISVPESRGFPEYGNVCGGFPNDAVSNGGGHGEAREEEEEEEERQEGKRRSWWGATPIGHPALNAGGIE